MALARPLPFLAPPALEVMYFKLQMMRCLIRDRVSSAYRARICWYLMKRLARACNGREGVCNGREGVGYALQM